MKKKKTIERNVNQGLPTGDHYGVGVRNKAGKMIKPKDKKPSSNQKINLA